MPIHFQRDFFQRRFLQCAAAVGMFAVLARQPGFASERVTLRSGFDVVCDHQSPVPDGVRLYLTPADDSYLDVSRGDIVLEEPVQASHTADASQRRVSESKHADIPEMLAHAGAQHHIDADLLASVIHAESNGNPHAVSRTGAQGLMQLMPGTASTLGVHDSFAPDENIAGGTAYLDWLLTRYQNNPVLALAAYNAGPAAVDRYHGVPPYAETRHYVARVLHDFNRRKRQLARAQSRSSNAASPSF